MTDHQSRFAYAEGGKFPRSDHGPVLGSGGLFLFAILMLGLGVFITITGWEHILTTAESDPTRPVILAIVAVCVAPSLVLLIQVIRLKRALGIAKLFLPYDYVPLGYSGNATYVRPLRGGVTVEHVEARLQCEEKIEKGSGKNKRTYRKVVIDEPVTPVMSPALHELRLQVPLRLPKNGPASFDQLNTSISWWLRFRLTVRGAPNTRSSFQIDVLPAVVE